MKNKNKYCGREKELKQKAMVITTVTETNITYDSVLTKQYELLGPRLILFSRYHMCVCVCGIL
jgi:hypothetical protein